jgi:sugar-specific transcriptional regulator TrmB
MLVDLGFDQVDAQVYVFLAKKGMQKARDIYKATKLTKQQLYPSLKRLQSKGVVNSTFEHPARFNAIPFERVLDIFIKAKIEETRNLQKSKTEILANWKNLKIEDDTSAKFTVIEGRTFIYSKIQQMIQEANEQLKAITTVPTLLQADQRDIFDVGFSQSSKPIPFRFLIDLSEKNVHAMQDLLDQTENSKLKMEGRNPDLGVSLFPQMFVRDKEEALFFTNPRNEASIIEKNDVCLWTDCKPLVDGFNAMFEEFWRNSTGIGEKIVEIETGKPSIKTLTIGDPEIAKEKYDKIVGSAKEEVIIMTSSKGLVEFSKNPQLSELTKKNVAIKIMAPIVFEDMEAYEELSKVCSVRHVAPNYFPLTVVDDKHLFHFQKSNPNVQALNIVPSFADIWYTNNSEYVQKMRNMLNEVWSNASPPSRENLKMVFGGDVLSRGAYFPGAIRSPGPNGTLQPLPPNKSGKGSYSIVKIVDEDPLRKLTEQDVLNHIIDSQKFIRKNETNLRRVYSSQAIAVIHPPEFFKLPPMLIRIHHIEKQSSFGAEDAIMINLWLETPNGPAYVPVAVLSDSPQAPLRWGKNFDAISTSRNVQVAKKDELQVWVHGNTLFAGWTIPIQLFPPEYMLPPACILIEGYGTVKTEAYSIIQVAGGKLSAKQNGFNAFVTFMHPSSKYSGPGTDGFLVRDFVMEVTPQFIKDFSPQLETKLIEKRRREQEEDET